MFSPVASLLSGLETHNIILPQSQVFSTFMFYCVAFTYSLSVTQHLLFVITIFLLCGSTMNTYLVLLWSTAAAKAYVHFSAMRSKQTFDFLRLLKPATHITIIGLILPRFCPFRPRTDIARLS